MLGVDGYRIMTTESLRERTLLLGLTELAAEMDEQRQKALAYHIADYVLTGFFGGGESSG
jgi:hypothetical protein